MIVKEFMVNNVWTCGPDTNLEAAAMMMWDHDCGSIPVVDHDGHPIGIITDRDIAMASALNHKALWDISAKEVMNGRPVFTCKSDDDIKAALRQMQSHKVRRLPVTDHFGYLEGILTIDDIVAGTEQGSVALLSFGDTINTLKAVCKHH